MGLVHALLVALAQSGKLAKAEEDAKKIMSERIEKKKAVGKDMAQD